MQKLALFTLVFFSVSWQTQAAIAPDGTPSTASTAGAASLTFAHTVSGSDRLLFVVVAYPATGTISTVTYNGVAQTGSASAVSGNIRGRLYYWVAPATGTNNVVITPTASIRMLAVASSYTGVDQTSPFGACGGCGSSSGNTANPSRNISSAANEVVFNALISETAAVSAFGAGQTSVCNFTNGYSLAACTEPGAATVTVSYTMAANSWAMLYRAMNPTVSGPIKLLSFNAHRTSNTRVKCSWITATEVNNDYFTLERSSDGILFEPVATLQGAGNSNTPLNYSTEDSY